MGQDQRRALGRIFICALITLWVAACSMAVQLAKPPNLYLDGKNHPDTLVPLELQVVSPPIFYITDREPEREDGRITGYGTDRNSCRT